LVLKEGGLQLKMEKKMRVMLVEDNQEISDGLARYFCHANFDVQQYEDGLAAWQSINRQAPDLLVLDLNLPSLSGWDICQRVRQKESIHDLPIIMLTACVAEDDRLQGFAYGADDYVTKPFSPREIIARAQALLKRCNNQQAQPSKQLKDDDLVYDPDAKTARLGQTQLALTPHESELLHVLMSNAGTALSRSRLIELAFGYDYESTERNIDVHIGSLRSKIEAPGIVPKRIQTVFGVGYRYRH